MSTINTTQLDFDQIKGNLIEYFTRTDSPFRDWNFTGSGLSSLLDVLSYNTHYNAMLAHTTAGESFLSSAQLRKNVVARAKTLGYVPHSAKASKAFIEIDVSVPGVTQPEIDLPVGMVFTGVRDSTMYTFTTTTGFTKPYGLTNIVVDAFQGSLRTARYIVDGRSVNRKYIIPAANVDTSILSVEVFDHANTTSKTVYKLFSSLATTTDASPVFFLEENSDGFYEISFGDNVVGLKPSALSIVQITYFVTDGEKANGISTFTSHNDNRIGVDDVQVRALGGSIAAGGSTNESIESIRANAPFSYISQDRAVTSDDYIAIINNTLSVESISVWGGEENTTPDYGKVFISVKPKYANALSFADRTKVLSVLKNKMVLTLKPVLIDPDYTYINPVVSFKYNGNLTNLSGAQLGARVRSAVATYNDTYLEKFDGVFRMSQFLAKIDGVDPSIINTNVVFTIAKTGTLNGIVSAPLTMEFGLALKTPSLNASNLASSGWKDRTITVYLGDEPTSNPLVRNVFTYYPRTVSGVSEKVKVQLSVGTLNLETGTLNIASVRGDNVSSAIRVFVTPASNDISPLRNTLLQISETYTVVRGEVDTIAMSGSSGVASYRPL